ncbi:MAG: hypothetical protein F4210_17880 [Holophagales bacterium]|nr:hypothetical protein [Holophagales bacterium]MYF97329.1 hypothetical protein [Holophagales bacterium]
MNLTISVDNHVLKRARIRAVEEDTSVNAVLRDCLEASAGGAGGNHRAVRRLLLLAETSESGRGGATWARDELHER